MSEGDRRLILSVGVLCIIIAVGIVLSLPQVALIKDYWMVPPFVIGLYGLWMIVLAGMKARSPEKYERGPFSTFSWGIMLTAIGGAWFLFGYNWIYSLLVIIVVIGILAIVVATRRKK